MKNVMKDCKHLSFHARVDVHCMEDHAGLLQIELAITCLNCKQLAVFHALPVGLSVYQPTVSLDGKELRISAMMDGKPVPKGLPGFGIFVPEKHNGD